jgi:hypothetical protein
MADITQFMPDVAFVGLGAGFLALCWLFVKVCERL